MKMPGRSDRQAMRRWPCSIRCVDRRTRPARVVEEDDVQDDVLLQGVLRRTVDERRRGAHVDLGDQVAVVVAGGHHEQAVHPALAQRPDQVALARRVLVGAAGDHEEVVRTGDLLHAAGDLGVEGVGDVLDDQAEAAGAFPAAERTGDVVAAEAERRDGGVDLLGRVRPYPHLAVDDTRDGLQAHAGLPGDITHGRPHGLPSKRRGRELITVHREDDNVVISSRRARRQAHAADAGHGLRTGGGPAAWP